MRIRAYRPGDRKGLVELWRACGLVTPANDPHRDIRRKLKVNPEWLLVAEEGGEVVASAMVGYEGHRGWINYLAVREDRRGQGYGRKLVERAERILRRAGCPKVNLQVRAGNRGAVGFYRALGFAEDAAISLGKRLVDDRRGA